MRVFKNGIELIENLIDKNKQIEVTSGRAMWSDGTPAHTIKGDWGVSIIEYKNIQDCVMGLRNLSVKNCIDELLWIWVKKSNKVSDLKSRIWDSWADDNGTIGLAYGAQLAKKYNFPEGLMDQVDWIIYQLKNNPTSRRMVTNIFNHQDLSQMGLQPCAYSISLTVVGDRLDMILNQRSNDILTALEWNVFQYYVLLMMFAHISGYKAGGLTHVIADAHIYDRHIESVKSLLENYNKTEESVIFDFEISDNVSSFYDFKVDSFTYKKRKIENGDIIFEVAI